MSYAAAVYDIIQVLNPASISLKGMPGATIDDDILILVREAAQCLNPIKTVAEVRQIADASLATRSNPKESVALVVFISLFVGCNNPARVSSINEVQISLWSFFEWKDRWDNRSEQFKNGYVAGVADTVQYLASLEATSTSPRISGLLLGSRLIQTAVGPCGTSFGNSPSKLKTYGDLLKFSEKALDSKEVDIHARQDKINLVLIVENDARRIPSFGDLNSMYPLHLSVRPLWEGKSLASLLQLATILRG